MFERSNELYQSMVGDIDDCRSKLLHPLEEVECCFQVSLKYWMVLQGILTDYEFQRPEDEILFFKIVKPQFTSNIEYYGLLYHTLIFIPGNVVSTDLENFWTRQQVKLKKFIADNEEFYTYYKSNQTDLDSLYFLRANNAADVSFDSAYYLQNARSATSCDHLVASIIALEKHTEYAEAQLRRFRNVF